MADIFISYARADRERIETLAAALEAEGLAVWWDRQIVGGAEFSAEIEKALDGSKAVLVAWSAHGNASPWVKDEATRARRQGKLVPALLDKVESPMGFGQYHAVDLADWKGDPKSPAFQDLLRALKGRISGEAPGVAADATPVRSRAPNARRVILACIAIGVVALLAAGLWFALRAPRNPDQTKTAATAPQTPEKSIAVLPFADMSAAHDQEYFADGMAEEILNVLTKIDGLKVSGRTSSFSFKAKSETAKTIGAALGVAHILEGSVRKQGDRVRITAQLIRADDGFHLWSEDYDRDLVDIFAVQDEIATAIANALSVKLGAGAAAASGETKLPAAHDLYLRARALLAMRSPPALQQAADLFRAAIVLDPDYAAAHAGLGRTLSVMLYFEDVRDLAAVMAQAAEAAKRAHELDPKSAEAYATLAQIDWYYRWDWAAAEAAMQRAVELAPNDAETVNFAGDHYRHRAELRKAEEFELRATELNPLYAVNFSDLSYILLYSNKCREALDAATKSIRLDKTHRNGWSARTTAQACLGRIKDAQDSLAGLAAASPGTVRYQAAVARVAFADGDARNVKEAIDALRRLGREGAQAEYVLADLLAHTGDHAGAAKALAAAYEKRDAMFILDSGRLIPEDWPDDPAIRAALDKPELNKLWEIRRKNLAANPRGEKQ